MWREKDGCYCELLIVKLKLRLICFRFVFFLLVVDIMEGKGFSCVTLFELPLVGGRLVMCARTKRRWDGEREKRRPKDYDWTKSTWCVVGHRHREMTRGLETLTRESTKSMNDLHKYRMPLHMYSSYVWHRLEARAMPRWVTSVLHVKDVGRRSDWLFDWLKSHGSSRRAYD